MDGNKDEALRCLKIAHDAIQSGDKNRALKLFNKARRLHPTIEIDEDLLSNLTSSTSDTVFYENPSDDISSEQPEPGIRRRVSTPGQSGSSSSATLPYTQEQIIVVREIKMKKDYYEILGLQKSCSVEDVRKAYRKLSLKVHPDKNKAPGSEEAFKKVSKAFQCLSNEENRKTYDLVGSDEPSYENRVNRRGAGGMQGFGNGYHEAEIDPEEIFRNFFFGGMNPANTTQFSFNFGPGVGVRMGGHRGGGGGGGSNGFMRTLLQVLPVILILLLNFWPSQQPIYSLSNAYPYQYRYSTQKGVNYFVRTRNFDQEYPPSSTQRVDLEQQVDHDYHSVVAHNCRLEMQQLHWGYRRETPYCDALKKFEAAG